MQKLPGHYDELRDPKGVLRAHYGLVIEDLKKRGVTGVKRLADTARRLLTERGVTFNLYEAGGMDIEDFFNVLKLSEKNTESIDKKLRSKKN